MVTACSSTAPIMLSFLEFRESQAQTAKAATHAKVPRYLGGVPRVLRRFASDEHEQFSRREMLTNQESFSWPA
jgi:hypothetical protein